MRQGDPAGTIRNSLRQQSVSSALRKGWQLPSALQRLIAPRVPEIAQSAVTAHSTKDDGRIAKKPMKQDRQKYGADWRKNIKKSKSCTTTCDRQKDRQ